MPKIDAPTVAEHHSRRRQALLSAAATLLADKGLDGVTLAAVGAAAGLARSSVYQYFDSTPALLAAVVEDVIPREIARLNLAVTAAGSPAERLDAFVRATLETAGDPTHTSLGALGHAALPPECMARIHELHDEQRAPLRGVVAELGQPDPELTVQLVMGMVAAAARAVADGQPLERVVDRTLALVHAGLGV
ncbi:MAG: TetR family transcriptional regulator [Cellulomonadaceae bacterium]|nr:TetR family transcriptional regulator [Cellulomonadaceae bacterium]